MPKKSGVRRVVAMDSHKSLCMPGRFLIYQKHGAHGGMEMCIHTVYTTTSNTATTARLYGPVTINNDQIKLPRL